MSLTLGDLKKMIEALNVPDDAEIWVEFPLNSGVKQTNTEETPCVEQINNCLGDKEIWISGSIVGWSPGSNKIRIYHHDDKN